MAIIQEIPFKVSARTARLIGRENVASAKGAIIELVKNAYDADSNLSVVYFDFRYTEVVKEINKHYFSKLQYLGVSEEVLKHYYEESNEKDLFQLKSLSKEEEAKFKQALLECVSIYIIDFGEGMTKELIENHWMTIGTDNKANNIFTKTGRVKSGAKGIGRFALDRLGSKCRMTTIFNPENHKLSDNENNLKGYEWNVNWEDFEGEGKTIDGVNATLTSLSDINYLDKVKSIVPANSWNIIESRLQKMKNIRSHEFGTILKISNLRDSWESYYIEQLYKDLEVLVPPKETADFLICLYSSLEPKNYGEITGTVCDDYDYKLVAKADNDQNVHITIYRNEYDIEALPPELFQRDGFKKLNYTKKDFERGFWETTKTFGQLLPGFKVVDKDNTFEQIGQFEFTLFFLKKTYLTKDVKRFFYRPIKTNERKSWLDSFSGIKLFRDDFRVRPYGEVNQSSFDWLRLGNRKAQSPAGVAKKGKGYRVTPENVSGAIKISRLTNIAFEDKSSREGLQDNKVFDVFQNLVTSIINEFEQDRSYIAQQMDEFEKFINRTL